MRITDIAALHRIPLSGVLNKLRHRFSHRTRTEAPVRDMPASAPSAPRQVPPEVANTVFRHLGVKDLMAYAAHPPGSVPGRRMALHTALRHLQQRHGETDGMLEALKSAAHAGLDTTQQKRLLDKIAELPGRHDLLAAAIRIPALNSQVRKFGFETLLRAGPLPCLVVDVLNDASVPASYATQALQSFVQGGRKISEVVPLFESTKLPEAEKREALATLLSETLLAASLLPLLAAPGLQSRHRIMVLDAIAKRSQLPPKACDIAKWARLPSEARIAALATHILPSLPNQEALPFAEALLDEATECNWGTAAGQAHLERTLPRLLQVFSQRPDERVLDTATRLCVKLQNGSSRQFHLGVVEACLGLGDMGEAQEVLHAT